MPKSYRVVIEPRASNDLMDICAYIEQDSPQNAVGVARRLFDEIDSLEFMPNRYKVHSSSRDPSRVVHAMSVPPFIVYHRVVERKDAVEVIAVLHGARRQPKRFK
jgi:plasmid stabilization system protein ParE